MDFFLPLLRPLPLRGFLVPPGDLEPDEEREFWRDCGLCENRQLSPRVHVPAIQSRHGCLEGPGELADGEDPRLEAWSIFLSAAISSGVAVLCGQLHDSPRLHFPEPKPLKNLHGSLPDLELRPDDLEAERWDPLEDLEDDLLLLERPRDCERSRPRPRCCPFAAAAFDLGLGARLVGAEAASVVLLVSAKMPFCEGGCDRPLAAQDFLECVHVPCCHLRHTSKPPALGAEAALPPASLSCF